MLACAHPAFDGPVILFQNIIERIIQTLTAILWCALIIVPGIEPTLPFFAHFRGARSSRRCDSRGGLPHRLSRAAGERMGCQHYRSAAGPECHFHRTIRHRPTSNVFGRCVDDPATPPALGSLWALLVFGGRPRL